MATEMSLIKRLTSPTPQFFKKVIRISLITASGAAALLLAETITKSVIPDFTYTIIPWVKTVAKNLVVAGVVAAAVAKAAKEEDPATFTKPAAPNDQSLKQTP